MFLCLSVSEFPSQGGNEIEPEVRKSRAAVIASEPIPETLEIMRNKVKKTARLVIGTDIGREVPFEQDCTGFLPFFPNLITSPSHT